MQRIGKLNNVHTTALQIVRSLFYNRANQSVILVTLDASDSFSAMKVRRHFPAIEHSS